MRHRSNWIAIAAGAAALAGCVNSTDPADPPSAAASPAPDTPSVDLSAPGVTPEQQRAAQEAMMAQQREAQARQQEAYFRTPEGRRQLEQHRAQQDRIERQRIEQLRQQAEQLGLQVQAATAAQSELPAGSYQVGGGEPCRTGFAAREHRVGQEQIAQRGMGAVVTHWCVPVAENR